MEITELTVHELMDKLSKNEITSEEITKAYIDGKKLIIETPYKDIEGKDVAYRVDSNYNYEFKEESANHYVFVKITKE